MPSRMPSWWWKMVAVVLGWWCCIIAGWAVRPVDALSTSPWAPASWTIRLDLGREAGTDAPPAYGEGGSRLVLLVRARAESATIPASQKDPFVGATGASVLSVEENGGGDGCSYITTGGEKRAVFGETGGWALTFPRSGDPGAASTLRAWIDLEEGEGDGVSRNSVVLPPGTRLLLAASCWREEAFEEGRRRCRPVWERAVAAQAALDKALSHESGDRRLDGTDALDTLKAYGDTAGLVMERNARRAELLEALQLYPPIPQTTNNRNAVAALFPDDENGRSSTSDDTDLPEGPWPGAEEWLTLSAANNPVFAVLPPPSKEGGLSQLLGGGGGGGGSRGESFLAGTWTATPVLEEGDYELVDDDDENHD